MDYTAKLAERTSSDALGSVLKYPKKRALQNAARETGKIGIWKCLKAIWKHSKAIWKHQKSHLEKCFAHCDGLCPATIAGPAEWSAATHISP